jgi:hypothetical protein
MSCLPDLDLDFLDGGGFFFATGDFDTERLMLFFFSSRFGTGASTERERLRLTSLPRSLPSAMFINFDCSLDNGAPLSSRPLISSFFLYLFPPRLLLRLPPLSGRDLDRDLDFVRRRSTTDLPEPLLSRVLEFTWTRLRDLERVLDLEERRRFLFSFLSDRLL